MDVWTDDNFPLMFRDNLGDLFTIQNGLTVCDQRVSNPEPIRLRARFTSKKASFKESKK